jgi:hypothetical protein
MSPVIAHPARTCPGASLAALMFGIAAAPIFWLGQLMLGYGVSAVACYGSDHPTVIASGASLRAALVLFDAVAIVAAVAGLAVSSMCLRALGGEGENARATGESRARFMALWGVLSSLWFLAAIVFNAIGSVTVPLCVG